MSSDPREADVQISELKSKIKAQRLRIDELEICLVQKSNQVDDGRATQRDLLTLLESSASDLMTKSKQLTEYANTLNSVSRKRETLDRMICQLKEDLKRKGAEWKSLEYRMHHQIEDLQSKLLLEKQKNINLVQKYVSLNENPCSKTSDTRYNTLTECSSIGKEGSLKNIVEPINKAGLENIKLPCAVNLEKVKDIGFDHQLQDETHAKPTNLNHLRTFIAGGSIKAASVAHQNNIPIISKNKRSASTWIDTRAHRISRGQDPHDDFLDTPFENIMETLNKEKVAEAENVVLTIHNSVNRVFKDKMQEVNVDPPKKKMYTQSEGVKNFKYVDIVRKKSERDNLKGIQCKQCKKFYEAVLPNNEGKNVSTNAGLPCEHHHGVSRHRYKHVPPMTPEGYWDIGFETEM